jgi:hypothetical protein
MALTFTNVTAPVGIRNGKTPMTNTQRDLGIAVDLFDRIPVANGGSAEIAGVWSTNRDALIAEVTAQVLVFQTANARPVIDGVIDPGGGTLKLMNKLAADRLITRMPGDPAWEDWGHKALPQLSHDKVPEIVWELTFGSSGTQRPMSTRAYECDAALGTPHVGIGWPTSVTRPAAYLIYFHHSIGQEAADYAAAGVRFKKGIGDYMIGRMKGLDQVSLSGKDVCLVVPEPTFGGQGVFETNEALVTEVLKEIDADLGGGQSRDLPPLLVASYSDGLGRLNNFMSSCPNLRRLVRGVYDFDGMLVSRFSGITLSNWAQGGAKVFRYCGNSSPAFLSKNEAKQAYLTRCINRSPKLIPLPKERWVNHPHFIEWTANPSWSSQWWMHFYIPSCMLRHGLANTDSI